MIGTSKPLASLSSGLLARKGQARPAMRPQGFLQMSPGSAQDDLGWNDMGEDYTPASVAGPTPYITPVDAPIDAPKPQVLRQIESLDEQLAAPQPTFDDGIDDEQAFEAPAAPVLAVKGKAKPMPEIVPDEPEAVALVETPVPEPRTVETVAKPAPKAVKARVAATAIGKAKAAFTLRLDHDRHLRLRLASALTRRSAQQLVTEALDQLLESLDGVDALARQVEPAKNHG